jgi:transmembrane sensor
MRTLIPAEDPERQLIRERAAQWVCELQEETVHLAEFTAWVGQSPRHIEEFLFAATIWKALDSVGPRAASDVQTAIDEALSLAGEITNNIVPLPSTTAALQPPDTAIQRFHLERHAPGRRWAIAAIIVLAIGISAGAGFLVNDSSTYTTVVGEQRTERLADGSLLYLNADSRVEVRFSKAQRSIRLLDGEAFFVVAHDPTRPFQVAAGNAVIQDIGTQFDVRRGIDDTTVSVLEGQVAIANHGRSVNLAVETTNASPTHAAALPQNPAEFVFISAGQEATVDPNGQVVKQSSQDASAVAVWRERRLVFRGDTLEDIAAQLNRYNTGQRFRIEGEAVKHRRFAGTFSADDPQALVRFLGRYEDLSVETTPQEFIIRAR